MRATQCSVYTRRRAPDCDSTTYRMNACHFLYFVLFKNVGGLHCTGPWPAGPHARHGGGQLTCGMSRAPSLLVALDAQRPCNSVYTHVHALSTMAGRGRAPFYSGALLLGPVPGPHCYMPVLQEYAQKAPLFFPSPTLSQSGWVRGRLGARGDGPGTTTRAPPPPKTVPTKGGGPRLATTLPPPIRPDASARANTYIHRPRTSARGHSFGRAGGCYPSNPSSPFFPLWGSLPLSIRYTKAGTAMVPAA